MPIFSIPVHDGQLTAATRGSVSSKSLGKECSQAPGGPEAAGARGSLGQTFEGVSWERGCSEY